MIDEKIIENAEKVILLIEKGILTKNDVRKMLGLKEGPKNKD